MAGVCVTTRKDSAQSSTKSLSLIEHFAFFLADRWLRGFRNLGVRRCNRELMPATRALSVSATKLRYDETILFGVSCVGSTEFQRLNTARALLEATYVRLGETGFEHKL